MEHASSGINTVATDNKRNGHEVSIAIDIIILRSFIFSNLCVKCSHSYIKSDVLLVKSYDL